jgi:hypothetical protein
MHKVYIQPTGRKIEPFGDSPGDVLIQNRSLSDWQQQMIAEAGLIPIEAPQPPCLQIPDTLFTTAGMLRGFVDAAAGRNAVLVLAESRFGQQTTPVQPAVVRVADGWRFDQVRFLASEPEACCEVVVDPQEKVIEFTAPGRYVDSDKPVTISLPKHPLITIHHWVHILWANQAAGAAEFRSRPRWRGALSGIAAVLRCRSLNRWRLLSKLNRIGRGCDIHPTAVIEGSTLGDGVSVGPYARVLFSTVGAGATIMAAAQVEASTLGERTLVTQQTVIRLCVLYPGATAGQQVMQQCVLGRDVVTTLASYSLDINFENDIRVPLDGEFHSTGTRFLGSAFGHRARIGTGFWLASGRMIPNDSFVVRHPDDVISRIPAGLPTGTPLFNDHGTLTAFPK